MCGNFNTIIVLTAFALGFIALVDSRITPSEQCSGQEFEDLRERIQVIPCGKTRCKLRKGTNTTVIFKFKPKKEVKSLKNDVYAEVGGLPLPFIGVTGADACPQVTFGNGSAAACPLAPDQEYVYTNVFPILDFYPSVGLRVHWSLDDGHKKVICFEVPAVIS